MERPSKPGHELEGLIHDKLPVLTMSISIVLMLRDSGRIGRANWDLNASNDDKREFIESCLSPSKKDLRLPTGLSSN